MRKEHGIWNPEGASHVDIGILRKEMTSHQGHSLQKTTPEGKWGNKRVFSLFSLPSFLLISCPSSLLAKPLGSQSSPYTLASGAENILEMDEEWIWREGMLYHLKGPSITSTATIKFTPPPTMMTNTLE